MDNQDNLVQAPYRAERLRLPQAEPLTPRRLVDSRQASHGDFCDTAAYAQILKDTIRGFQGADAAYPWMRLTPVQKEALDAMTVKIARLLSGDPASAEHWNDIGGYAQLAADAIGHDQDG